MKFATKAIHAGQAADETTGAMIPPIYMTSTYKQSAPDTHKGYDYTRAGNPNFTNFEAALAAVENGEFATVFSSGLGATSSLAATLKAGDHVVAIDDLYGGTYRLFTKIFKQYGVEFSFISLNDTAELEAAIRPETKMLWIESPTNPLLKVVDITALSAVAKRHNVRSVVDNTFATPFFQNPLDLGADVVLHSTTKYIGGHSDVVGGAIITNDKELKTQVDFHRMAIGLNPSPFDVWLGHRGLKTLAVRMERHQENAKKLAEFFEAHSKVKRVYYPGLASHKNHAIAAKQMRGFSGIVSVEFDMSLEETKKMISSYSVFSLAESLGGIESLVDHPSSMTHASIPKEEREKIGLADGLVRYSVGIEAIEDIIDDVSGKL